MWYRLYMGWVLIRLPWMIAPVAAVFLWTLFSAFLPRGRFYAIAASMLGFIALLISFFFLASPLEELAVIAGASLLFVLAHISIYKYRSGKA